MASSRTGTEDLGGALAARYPQLERVRAAAGETPLYVVGGALRDLLLGLPAGENLDLVLEGDAVEVARALGGELVEHDRFATAKAVIDGLEIDLASARAESYPTPGALPEVRRASLVEDLARRDFTVNAIAFALQGDAGLIDPYGGRADIDAGLLRILHERSFVEDPTRAIRAARYGARLGFALEGKTERLVRETDLATISADRRRAELARLAAEPAAVRGFELLREWDLLALDGGEIELLRALDTLLAGPPWSEVAARDRTLLTAALGETGRASALATADPTRPSEGVEAARGASAEEIAIGRAMGGAWLDDYVGEWRSVVLAIDGSELIAAGVPEGPAVGRGLRAALAAKLDGEISSRDEELAVALEAARGER